MGKKIIGPIAKYLVGYICMTIIFILCIADEISCKSIGLTMSKTQVSVVWHILMILGMQIYLTRVFKAEKERNFFGLGLGILILPTGIIEVMKNLEKHPVITGTCIAVCLLSVILHIVFNWKIMWSKNEKSRRIKTKVINRILLSANISILCIMMVIVPLWEVFYDFMAEDKFNQTYMPRELVLKSLKEDNWEFYTRAYKLDVIQNAVIYECTEELKCEGIEVKLGEMEETKGGYFTADENDLCIYINEELIDTESAESILSIVLHETFHWYSYVCVDIVDDVCKGDIPKVQYFEQVAKWKDGFMNYISSDVSYESYYLQPLEADAREYAMKRTEEIREEIQDL